MRLLWTIAIAALCAAGCGASDDSYSPGGGTRGDERISDGRRDRGSRRLETVAEFHGAMPTGVTVSQEGRIFVNFPRWGDDVRYTVAEVKNARAEAYPNPEINRADQDRPQESFVSVQSVVVDPRNRLWVLDTGSIEFGPVVPGAAKLVGIDLSNDRIIKTITFPRNVALPTTYLNDVRFDLRRGTDGLAFITDSSMNGPNGIIVVDLASGRSWRKLNDHPSTKPQSGFTPVVEDKPFMQRRPGQPPEPVKVGADGIAMGADGERLYYAPLIGRNLYSVSVDALADEKVPDDDVARTVQDHGPKPGASDGLESDAQNRIYATDYEHNAIHRRPADGGNWQTIAKDEKLLWPDTLSLAPNGYLYIISNQLHRQKAYNNGEDLRQKPYHLFRINLDARPVLLK